MNARTRSKERLEHRLERERNEAREQRDELLAALKRLLEESCPFECSIESCECGPTGDGFDDEGNPCEHIQGRRAIANATKGGNGG